MIDLILIFKIIFLGIIEGLTEFLPVSSTGHLIVCANMINFDNKFATLFEIVIQLGAILAVVWLYKEKIISLIKTAFKNKKSYDFIINLMIAFIPASVVGFFFHGIIKNFLFNPITVAFALIIGGYIIIYIENKKIKVRIQETFDITKKSALVVGLAQILALFPGVSRAASTIMGGLCCGLSRKASTEFSFFLAIPIMFTATLYDLYKSSAVLNIDSIIVIAIGFVSAFVSAILVIKWFVKYISVKNFKIFGWYRILFGAFLLGFFYFVKGI